MLTIIIRSVLIYLIVLFVFRVMGKRQLGQMQPFELVLTLIIADLATIPMAEVSMPVLHGIIPLLTLVVLHFIITFLTRKSTKISKFVSGKPMIVVNPKGIDYYALKNLNLSTDDLFEALRGSGFFSLEDVQYAIMETNGKLSVMPKSQSAPVTNQDMQIEVEEKFLPITLVSEGKIIKENSELAGYNEEKILSLAVQNGAKKLKDVLILQVDKKGNGFFQSKNGDGISFSVERLVKE